MRACVLLVLVALLAAAGVEAVRTGKLQRRMMQHQQQQQYHQQSFPMAATAPVFDPAAMIQQTESAGQGNEIMSALQQLLEQKKASGEAARAQLESAAAHTLAVEASLAAKQRQLQSHNAMLQRLEQCLASGPESVKVHKLAEEVQKQSQSLLEAKSTVEAKNKQLAEQEEELSHEKEALEETQAELEEKEEKLHKAEQHLTEQQSLLEQQAASVHERETNLAATIAAKVEEGVQAKLAALKAEMEAKAEDKLNAVKQAMEAQAHAMLIESRQVATERKATSIAERHQMRALTSVDSSPYALAADEAMAAEEGMEPMLIETHALTEAAPSTQAATTKNATTLWAEKLARHCAQYKDCGTCGGDGRCGWCGTGAKGKCLSLDVNANLRAGSSAGDGLTSGQCTSDQWQTSVASRLTLLSLNVFASERGNSTRRFAAIVQLIKKSGADVVALQEVEKWFVHALQAHSWIKNNFHFSEYGPGQAPGGLYILSRYPIADVNYYENIQPGQVEVNSRGRLLVAKLGVKQQAVYVATTALDYRSAENRAASLEFIFRTLKPYRHAFLLGDFNFDEGSKLETQAVPISYLDLWPTLVTDRPGYTWDPRSNWFAAASDPQSRASRIDRIYLRSNQWMPRSIHLVGCSVSDPLCGAKNLDIKKGVTVVDANKLNPSLILAAPTNDADKPEPETAAFVETSVEISARHSKAARPTFEADFVASNHYGLLVQATQFAPKCPVV